MITFEHNFGLENINLVSEFASCIYLLFKNSFSVYGNCVTMTTKSLLLKTDIKN